jgi:hypothetical protein
MTPLCSDPDQCQLLNSAQSHVRLTFPCVCIILGFQGALPMAGVSGAAPQTARRAGDLPQAS